MQAFVYITADFKTAQNAVNGVMIWSRIVQEKRRAKINERVRLEYPYALTDPSMQLCHPILFNGIHHANLLSPFQVLLLSPMALQGYEICVLWRVNLLKASKLRNNTHAGYSMRNLTFDLHMDWETVPVVGVLHRSRQSFKEFVFPTDYFRTSAVPRSSNSGW